MIKRRDTQTLHCPPAPVGVIEGSRADVSFIAGMVVDKFAYHLPLYRQHQRVSDSGITVSRPWLMQLTRQAAQLAEPIYDAQLDSVRASRVKAMDETPIKAGRAGPGRTEGVAVPLSLVRAEPCLRRFVECSSIPCAEAAARGYRVVRSYDEAVAYGLA